MRLARNWAILAVASLASLAFAPLLILYFQRLWSLPQYQLFPLTLLGCAALLRRDILHTERTTTGAWGWTVAACACCWLLLAAAVVAMSPWPAYLSFLATGGAAAYAWGGWVMLRNYGPTLLLGLTILRPPFGWDTTAIQNLQRFTAAAASRLLDLFGVLHHLSGNVVELPGRRLLVEEACSGMTSLMSVCSLTLFYCLWHRRSWLVSLTLLTAAVVWTIVANIGRITLVAALRFHFGWAFDEGWAHEFSGFLAFGFALIMVWSTDCGLGFCAAVLSESEREAPASAGKQVPPLASTARPRFPGVALLVGAAGCLWLAICQISLVSAMAAEVAEASGEAVAQETRDRLFPEAVGPWKRGATESVVRERTSAFGRFTEKAEYRASEGNLVTTLDYPFAGWHNLAECYEAQGWQITSHREERLADGLVVVRLQLRHYLQSRFAYCTFTLFDRRGGAVEPAAARWDLMIQRWRKALAKPNPWVIDPATTHLPERTAYQAQVLVERYVAVTEEESAAADEMIRQFVAQAKRQVSDSVANSAGSSGVATRETRS